MKEVTIPIVVAVITGLTTITTTWMTQVSPKNDEIAQLRNDIEALKKPPKTAGDAKSAPYFQVLSIAHKNTNKGKYFHFDASDLDAILSRKNWDNTTISVSPNEKGIYRDAVVWRSVNGGPGSAHGRYNKGEQDGDWRSGDLVYVKP